jgi:hypothetical protein
VLAIGWSANSVGGVVCRHVFGQRRSIRPPCPVYCLINPHHQQMWISREEVRGSRLASGGVLPPPPWVFRRMLQPELTPTHHTAAHTRAYHANKKPLGIKCP